MALFATSYVGGGGGVDDYEVCDYEGHINHHIVAMCFTYVIRVVVV